MSAPVGWDLTDLVMGSFQRKTHRWSEIPHTQAQGQLERRVGGRGWGPQMSHTITGTADKTSRKGDGKIDRGFNEPRAQLDIPRPSDLRRSPITLQIIRGMVVMCEAFSDAQKAQIYMISATLLNLVINVELLVFHMPSESG